MLSNRRTIRRAPTRMSCSRKSVRSLAQRGPSAYAALLQPPPILELSRRCAWSTRRRSTGWVFLRSVGNSLLSSCSFSRSPRDVSINCRRFLGIAFTPSLQTGFSEQVLYLKIVDGPYREILICSLPLPSGLTLQCSISELRLGLH